MGLSWVVEWMNSCGPIIIPTWVIRSGLAPEEDEVAGPPGRGTSTRPLLVIWMPASRRMSIPLW